MPFCVCQQPYPNSDMWMAAVCIGKSGVMIKNSKIFTKKITVFVEALNKLESTQSPLSGGKKTHFYFYFSNSEWVKQTYGMNCRLERNSKVTRIQQFSTTDETVEWLVSQSTIWKHGALLPLLQKIWDLTLVWRFYYCRYYYNPRHITLKNTKYELTVSLSKSKRWLIINIIS